MGISRRRVGAIFRKEVREFRRNGSIVATMAVIPLVFLIQPVLIVLKLSAAQAGFLLQAHVLLYTLAVPALVPALVASFAIVGERTQATLEPVLTTPIRRDELLLGKALAAFVPAVGVAYVVLGAFIAFVKLFADPDVASGMLRWQDLVAQVVFTPLVAAWSISLGIAVSTRVTDTRVAQQLGTVASLPTAVVTSLVAFNVIHATLALAIGAAALLLLLDGLGWWLISLLLDRERLITGTR
jgi:ABC-type transport system involved in multi-copper enzyme maturation permease subunit